MNGNTKARIGVAGLVAALLLPVASCTDSEDPAPGGGSTGTPAASATAEPEPRTVEGKYGEVTVTGRPARVVTLHDSETDLVLQLGVTPVAMIEPARSEPPPWQAPLLDGEIPIIEYSASGFTVEEILSHEPDLVVARADLDQQTYDALSATVPTLAVPEGISSDEHIQLVGAALARPAEAEKLAAELTASLDAARQKYPLLNGSPITIAWANPDDSLSVNPGMLKTGLMAELGIVEGPAATYLPELVQPGPDGVLTVDPVDWALLIDGDVVLVWFADEAQQQRMEAMPEFQRIRSVEKGRYLGTTDSQVADLWVSVSPAQMEYALEHALPTFAPLLG